MTSAAAGSTVLTIPSHASFVRLASSVSGNPRYRITFDNGQSAVTKRDAGFVFGVENRENIGVPVRVTFNSRGEITDVTPV